MLKLRSIVTILTVTALSMGAMASNQATKGRAKTHTTAATTNSSSPVTKFCVFVDGIASIHQLQDGMLGYFKSDFQESDANYRLNAAEKAQLKKSIKALMTRFLDEQMPMLYEAAAKEGLSRADADAMMAPQKQETFNKIDRQIDQAQTFAEAMDVLSNL